MIIQKLFSKLIVCVIGICLTAGAFGATNLPTAGGDIGDFGTWATEHNRDVFVGDMERDLSEFQAGFQSQVVENYVPIEAKVGMAFMNGMALVGRILDATLVRFMIIFIIIVYAFWIAFEAYQLINGTAEVRKTIEGIIKKGGMIIIWTIVLEFGAAQIFMWVMGPIITIGTYMSDLILNAVTGYVGVSLPDTCAVIREYAAVHAAADGLIDADAAANLMCVPTRLSGFFYTGVAVGFKWMAIGIGTSAFTFLIGVAFVVLFIMNIWKFALIALGVIADLFLGIFMLPFTALTETIGKTSYKGIAGDIFNGFLGLFSAESLSKQIGRFIKAAIYFVSLSIVVAVCAAIMSGVIDADTVSHVPTMRDTGFIVLLMIAALVWYLADKAESLAKDLGGEIDASMGQKVRQDVVNMSKAAYGKYKEVRKLIKESKSGGSGNP